jgi:hypothetical protein
MVSSVNATATDMSSTPTDAKLQFRRIGQPVDGVNTRPDC